MTPSTPAAAPPETHPESAPGAPPEADLAAAVLDVLARKGPALTPAQVRSNLPRRGQTPAADLTRCLEELAAQGKVHAWPPYRSTSPRWGLRSMEECGRDTMSRLLNEEAFTKPELIAEVREEVRGLSEEQCGQMLAQILEGGQVRTLPPRLGGNTLMYGTPDPGSYLLPLFEGLVKNMEKLFVRLESEGVTRESVLEKARHLWHVVVRKIEKELSPPASPTGEAPAESGDAPAENAPMLHHSAPEMSPDHPLPVTHHAASPAADAEPAHTPHHGHEADADRAQAPQQD